MCVCETRWVIQYEVRVFTEDNSSGVTTGVCVSVCVDCKGGIMSRVLKGGGVG